MCWLVLMPATLLAQQPTETRSVADSQAVRKPITNRVQILSNGIAVPFATVINVNSGAAAAADAEGMVMMPGWNSGDTLRIQSLGFEDLLVAPEPMPNLAVNLVPSTVDIEEVVVQSNAQLTSMSTAIMDVERLAMKVPVLAVETTGDLLQESGQVHLQMSQQGGISPVLRGFEANRVLLVVDGVRMNNAIYRSGHIQNAGTIDPFSVVRTDVIMGPSSVMYGSDALGGVVHFMTESPQLSNGSSGAVQGEVLGQFNSANEGWSGHAKLAWNGRRVATVTTLTRRHFGDLTMGSRRLHGDSTWGLVPHYVARIDGRDSIVVNPDPKVQVTTGFDQIDAMHRVRVRLPKGYWDVNLQHSTTTNIPRFDALNDVTSDGVTPRWAEWSYGPQRRTLLSSRLQHSLRDVQWVTIGSYQRIGEERIKRRHLSDERVTQTEAVHVVGLSSSFRGRWGGWGWESGLDAQWNDVASTAFSEDVSTGRTQSAATRYADGGSSMNTLAAFGAAQRQFGSTRCRMGMRWSWAQVQASFQDTTWLQLTSPEFDQSQGALTGSVSALTRWSDRWSSIASLSSGFRHPNVDDIGKIREKGGFVLLPNPELKPEYLYTAEQAVSWQLNPNRDVLKVDAAVFGSLWNDAIVQANAEWDGDTLFWIDGDWARVQTNQNLDRAWVRGARVNLSARLWPQTTFNGVINWTRGNSLDEGRVPLSHIPPTFGMAEVEKSLPFGRVGAYVQFAMDKGVEDYGPGSTDNLDEALPAGNPGWATLNLETTVKLLEGMDLRLAGLNLTDVHYKTFGSGLSAAGRGVRATLSARF